MKSLMVCLMSLLVFVQAGAQATVAGQVRLSGGLPVAEARVMLFDLSDLRRGVVAQATTDADGLFALPLAALGGAVALPEGFALGANYPNPFNPATIIPYQLAATVQVRLEVFNALGQRMALLVEGEQGAGSYQARWDGTDAVGRAAAAGVYLYRLTVDGVQQTGRMVLVDGQAGVPMGGGSVEVLPMAGAHDAAYGVYGLVVSGEGLVAYIDADFRVVQGMEPVAIEVAAQPDVRMKVVQSGILGDVDNNGQVDTADGLLVAMYLANPSISMPNNVDISRGDVNCDRRTDWMDAWLIVTYSIDPSDPAVQSLQIGQSGGCAEEEVRGGGNTAATMMYWIKRNGNVYTIHRANLDGSDVQDLVSVSVNSNTYLYAHNFVLDATGSKMYWALYNHISDVYTIHRANLDGSDVQDLVSEYSDSHDSNQNLVLDAFRGRMYWISRDRDGVYTIHRANLDGSDIQDLVFGLGRLRNLVLDATEGKIYWIDSIGGVNSIQRVDLDGSNRQIVFIQRFRSLYLWNFVRDASLGKMYWISMIDNKEHTIHGANLDGSNHQDLIFGLGQLYNLVLDATEGKIYWIGRDGVTIQRANLDGFNAQNLVNVKRNMDIRLYNLVLDAAKDKMYWRRDGVTIQRANLDGSDVEDIVTGWGIQNLTLFFP